MEAGWCNSRKAGAQHCVGLCQDQVPWKNNRVIIEDGVRLHHVKIQISGNDNTIIIGRNCSIQDTIFAMEEDHNSVTLGAGTTTTGGVVFSAIEGSKIIVGNDGMISRDVWFLQVMDMEL